MEHVIAVRPAELDIIEVQPLNIVDRVLRYQSRLKKLLFFVFREGPLSTWRKITSRWKAQAIRNEAVFIVAKHHNQSVYFCGRQYSINQEFFYFSTACVFNQLPEKSTLQRVRKYNVFSDLPAPIEETERSKKLLAQYSFQSIIQTSPSSSRRRSEADLYLIGCGDYVRTQVIPVFADYNFKLACDFNPLVLGLAELRSFEYRTNCFDNIARAIVPDRLSVAIIASYHSYHTRQANTLLQYPHVQVMIEKPPCVTRDDLERLVSVFDPQRVTIGYNRRHIPWNKRVKELIAKHKEPVVISIEITEVQITHEHWYFWPNQGTRITGNLCHWLDLCVYWLDTLPVELFVGRNRKLGIDHSTFSVAFADGSMAHFVPTDLGNGTWGVREKISIRAESFEVNIDDYMRLHIWERGRDTVRYALIRDKGHKKMYQDFRSRIQKGIPHAYTIKDLVLSTELYLHCVELFNSDRASCQFKIDQYVHLFE